MRASSSGQPPRTDLSFRRSLSSRVSGWVRIQPVSVRGAEDGLQVRSGMRETVGGRRRGRRRSRRYHERERVCEMNFHAPGPSPRVRGADHPHARVFFTQGVVAAVAGYVGTQAGSSPPRRRGRSGCHAHGEQFRVWELRLPSQGPSPRAGNSASTVVVKQRHRGHPAGTGSSRSRRPGKHYRYVGRLLRFLTHGRLAHRSARCRAWRGRGVTTG